MLTGNRGILELEFVYVLGDFSEFNVWEVTSFTCLTWEKSSTSSKYYFKQKAFQDSKG